MLRHLAEASDARIVEAARRTSDLGDEMAEVRALLTSRVSALRSGKTGTLPASERPLRRQVFDCENAEDVAGTLERHEGWEPVRDVAVNEAFDNSGSTWRFFHELFGRNSVDGQGKILVSYVDYGTDFDNALWTGKEIVYGDGDGDVFHRFTGAIEIVAHEITHGVTQNSAKLRYQGQSGALNEHFSDVFGSLVKQWLSKQPARDADWLIGAGIRGPKFVGRAIRDMENPGTAYDGPLTGADPQPAHMNNYVETDDDSGGVHINSGIPNRTFVLAAKAIGGNAWDVPGQIWYETLTNGYLSPESDFKDCARGTILASRKIHSGDATVAEHVAAAWVDTGVLDTDEARRLASGV
jgi:Zn-dependent metalloprotease